MASLSSTTVDGEAKVTVLLGLLRQLDDGDSVELDSDIESFMATLAGLVKGTHYGVVLNSLMVLTRLVSRMGPQGLSTAAQSNAFKAGLSRLADAKEKLRVEAVALLAQLSQNLELVAAFDKDLKALFSNKTPVVREMALRWLQQSLDLNEGAESAQQYKEYIALSFKQLDDPASAIREAGRDSVVSAYIKSSDALKQGIRRQVTNVKAALVLALLDNVDKESEGVADPSPPGSQLSLSVTSPTTAAGPMLGGLQIEPDDSLPSLRIYSEVDYSNYGDKIIATLAEKETEENWNQRDKTLETLRALIHSANRNREYAPIVGQIVRDALGGIVQSVLSLRTQLNLKACRLASDLVILLRSSVDGVVQEQLTTSALKLCQQARKIVIPGAAKFLETASVTIPSIRMANHLAAGVVHQNKDYRVVVANVFFTFAFHCPPALLTKLGAEFFTKILKTTVVDALPPVREVSRLTLWALRKTFPGPIDQLVKSFDSSIQKLISQSESAFKQHTGYIYNERVAAEVPSTPVLTSAPAISAAPPSSVKKDAAVSRSSLPVPLTSAPVPAAAAAAASVPRLSLQTPLPEPPVVTVARPIAAALPQSQDAPGEYDDSPVSPRHPNPQPALTAAQSASLGVALSSMDEIMFDDNESIDLLSMERPPGGSFASFMTRSASTASTAQAAAVAVRSTIDSGASSIRPRANAISVTAPVSLSSSSSSSSLSDAKNISQESFPSSEQLRLSEAQAQTQATLEAKAFVEKAKEEAKAKAAQDKAALEKAAQDKARAEQEAKARADQARAEQEAKARADQARAEQEAKARADQARAEQEARADQARAEQEAKAEKARAEQEAKERANQARAEQEAKAEKARAEQEAKLKADTDAAAAAAAAEAKARSDAAAAETKAKAESAAAAEAAKAARPRTPEPVAPPALINGHVINGLVTPVRDRSQISSSELARHFYGAQGPAITPSPMWQPSKALSDLLNTLRHSNTISSENVRRWRRVLHIQSTDAHIEGQLRNELAGIIELFVDVIKNSQDDPSIANATAILGECACTCAPLFEIASILPTIQTVATLRSHQSLQISYESSKALQSFFSRPDAVTRLWPRILVAKETMDNWPLLFSRLQVATIDATTLQRLNQLFQETWSSTNASQRKSVIDCLVAIIGSPANASAADPLAVFPFIQPIHRRLVAAYMQS